MLELICTLRASQLFLHHAHLLAKGPLFMPDHEFLADLYSEIESDFDAVSERLIGTGGEDKFNLQSIMNGVNVKLKTCPGHCPENKVAFQKQMEFEKQICELVENLVVGASEGTIQLLGDVANRSEIRQYKIGRRIK